MKAGHQHRCADTLVALFSGADAAVIATACSQVDECERALAYNVSPETCLDTLLFDVEGCSWFRSHRLTDLQPRTLWFDPGDLDIEGHARGGAHRRGLRVRHRRERESSRCPGADARAEERPAPVERIATEEDIEQAAEMERASAEALPVFKEMAQEYHEDMRGVRGVSARWRQGRLLLRGRGAHRLPRTGAQAGGPLPDAHRHASDRRARREPAWWAASGTAARSCAASDSAASSAPCPSAWPRSGALAEPQKISGLCGRLMCCLLRVRAYKDFKSRAPKLNATVQTPAGPAKVVDHDACRRESCR